MKILTSGVFHIEDEEEAVLMLSEDKFSFSFKKDDGTARYEGFVENKNWLRMLLFNHDNPLGQGQIKPLNVAVYNGGKLYLTYFVHAITDSSNSKSSYRLEYIFYVEKENVSN